MSIMKLRTGGVDPVGCQEFFDKIVPVALEHQKDLATQLGGRLAFQLFGEDGGEWTVDLTSPEIKRGAEDDVDLYLEMSAPDFTSMIAGTLDVEGAADGGRIRFNGDIGHLANLIALFDTPEA